MEEGSMGRRHIVAMEIGSRRCPYGPESYRVMFGRDEVRATYSYGMTESYTVTMASGEGNVFRERMESLEPGSWSTVVDACQDDESAWSMAVLFDDGRISECSGMPGCIPEYETMMEILMDMFEGVQEE